MDTGFEERYAGLTDDELLHIAGDRRNLLEQAAVALKAEMARRGLTFEHARARNREHRRREFEEINAHIAKRSKSKYFVANINLRVWFAGLAGEVLLMVLLPGGHRMQEEWVYPLIVVYLGALLATLSVQTWVRRTLGFWISLVVSFVPQFFVARWLAIYHPAHSGGGEKGSAILSLLAGYAVGVPLFLLLQMLKPSHGDQAME